MILAKGLDKENHVTYHTSILLSLGCSLYFNFRPFEITLMFAGRLRMIAGVKEKPWVC